MFTNRQINNYTYATRYIASWLREGGKLRTGKDVGDFCRWLSSMGLSEDEVRHIKFLAENGKMELEDSARKFLAELAEK